MVDVRLTIETARFPDPTDDERVVYSDLERVVQLSAVPRTGEWVDITPPGWLKQVARPVESVTHDSGDGAVTCKLAKFVDGEGDFVDRASAAGWRAASTSLV